ncbi:MAG: hypothetical protein SFU98_18050 [Leptospiraceae bacterium]|nr:hypothetical protein [Leptospiraceae bacterium]
MAEKTEKNLEEELEKFNTKFQLILDRAELDKTSRILKMDMKIPEFYEKNMEAFLEKFFSKNPFELRKEDLEDYTLDRKVLKRLRFDRRPASYLSLFRFIEMYRQGLNIIKQNISVLASIYKYKEPRDIFEEQQKEILLNELLSAGRVFKKLQSLNVSFYATFIKHLNDSYLESTKLLGEDGFINIKKLNGDTFLATTFYPYYDQMITNSIFLETLSIRLRQEREKWQARYPD